MILRLHKPIVLGSETISELTFREPVAKDLRKMSMKPSTGEVLDLAAALTNQPPSTIDRLSIKDTHRVLEIVGDFMDYGPETGNKP